jgi:hypothetical protein
VIVLKRVRLHPVQCGLLRIMLTVSDATLACSAWLAPTAERWMRANGESVGCHLM